jgi:GT2 family glycosyltransferase
LATTWLRRYIPALILPLHLHPLPKEPIEVEAISGACMMVSRAAIAAVGPLDEQYFLHCEDLDWCMRFHQRGWTILFVPEAKVVHHKGVSSRQQPLAVEYYKHRGMVLFYRKFLSDTYPRWLMVFVVLGVWVRFAALAMRRLLT